MVFLSYLIFSLILNLLHLMLFLVDHIRYLAKAEHLAFPAMRVHLRIIPALAAEGLDDDLLMLQCAIFQYPGISCTKASGSHRTL